MTRSCKLISFHHILRSGRCDRAPRGMNHMPRTFYKHTTADTAKLILANRKLRWSMPKLFNDPFDVPETLVENLDENSTANGFVEITKILALNPELPDPQHLSDIGLTLLSLFRIINDQSRDAFLSDDEPYKFDFGMIRSGFQDWRNHWRTLYKELRVICFTERWDSASMWDRYSEGHRGVVIEFECIERLDSAWLAAKPVKYTDESLWCNTPLGFASLMLYEFDYAIKKIYEEHTHTKTSDWAYEKEWRVATFSRPEDTGEYSDWLYHKDEVAGVTFGAQASDQAKVELKSILQTHFPQAKIWQASLGTGRNLTRSLIDADPG